MGSVSDTKCLFDFTLPGDRIDTQNIFSSFCLVVHAPEIEVDNIWPISIHDGSDDLTHYKMMGPK